MEQKVNLEGMTKEQLIALLSKARGTSSESKTVESIRNLVGQKARLVVSGIEVPIEFSAFQLDKRSCAFLLEIKDTMFGLKHGRKDISTLIRDLSPKFVENQEVLKVLQKAENVKLKTKKAMALNKTDFEETILAIEADLEKSREEAKTNKK